MWDLFLGDGAEGTSPSASGCNIDEQSVLEKPNEDLPEWLHEMITNQVYDLSHLLSAPVTKCFPCIACKNHNDIDDPNAWI